MNPNYNIYPMMPGQNYGMYGQMPRQPMFKLYARGQGIDQREYDTIIKSATNAYLMKLNPLSTGTANGIKQMIGGEWFVFVCPVGVNDDVLRLLYLAGQDKAHLSGYLVYLGNIDKALFSYGERRGFSDYLVEVLTKGKGSLVYDDKGKEYIDLSSGIAVNTFGYCDDSWLAAVINQASLLQHTSNLYYSIPCVELAEMLCQKTGMEKVFFSNSGAEANECAIKTARKWAAIKKECVIIGVNDRLEIWALDSYNNLMQDNFDKLDEIAENLFDNGDDFGL